MSKLNDTYTNSNASRAYNASCTPYFAERGTHPEWEPGIALAVKIIPRQPNTFLQIFAVQGTAFVILKP